MGHSVFPLSPWTDTEKGEKGGKEKEKRERERKRKGKGEEDEIKEGQEMKEALATSGSGCCGLAGSIGKAPGTYTIFLSLCVSSFPFFIISSATCFPFPLCFFLFHVVRFLLEQP